MFSSPKPHADELCKVWPEMCIKEVNGVNFYLLLTWKCADSSICYGLKLELFWKACRAAQSSLIPVASWELWNGPFPLQTTQCRTLTFRKRPGCELCALTLALKATDSCCSCVNVKLNDLSSSCCVCGMNMNSDVPFILWTIWFIFVPGRRANWWFALKEGPEPNLETKISLRLKSGGRFSLETT